MAYADVNGLHMYYEIHGNGEPLVLLHGGLGAGDMFGENLERLASVRKVILPDMQGHGRTADIDRPIRIPAMADDVAALLDHLGIASADVMGYSMGGGIALQLAFRHPHKVKKLISGSAGIRRSATYPEILQQQGFVNANAMPMMQNTPMYKTYVERAPRPEDFPRLLDKMGEAMSHDFDFTEDFKKLEGKEVLIVAADSDLHKTAHTFEMFELLGGGQRDPGWDGSMAPKAQLAVLPGLTHYNTFLSPLFAMVAIQFLEPDKPLKW